MEQALTLNPMSIQARNKTVQETIQKERNRLLNYIRRRISNRADAEDILQDVLYQFTNATQLDVIDKAAAWLYKAASNKIIDWYRKNRPLSLEAINENRADETMEDDLPLRLEDILFDPTENPDTLYLRSTIWPLLTEVLEELPEEQSSVFVMHELEDMNFKEIAAMTGVPVNTLISRKRYAVLYLRERLQDLYNEFFNE